MLLAPLADNLGVMWVAIESTTLASVLLVTFYNQKTSFEAGWKYVIIGSVGISLALFGTVITYSSAVGVLPLIGAPDGQTRTPGQQQGSHNRTPGRGKPGTRPGWGDVSRSLRVVIRIHATETVILSVLAKDLASDFQTGSFASTLGMTTRGAPSSLQLHTN